MAETVLDWSSAGRTLLADVGRKTAPKRDQTKTLMDDGWCNDDVGDENRVLPTPKRRRCKKVKLLKALRSERLKSTLYTGVLLKTEFDVK